MTDGGSVSGGNGFATAAGTARYAERFSARVGAGHFRLAAGLEISTLGLGSYLGREDDEDDARYAEAVSAALRLGANVLDTAINYRAQRSERVIGLVLRSLVAEGAISRDEVVVATKGGYLPFDGSSPSDGDETAAYLRRTFVESGLVADRDLVGGIHCLSPAFLRDQIGRSLANLGLDTLDVYYLHNPEQQLTRFSRRDFRKRMRAAFEMLEDEVARNRIRLYGTATWSGYRADPDDAGYLSLSDLVDIARDAGGPEHHFRVVQLPYNLAMHEAFTLRNQIVRKSGDETWVPLLEAATRFGVTVMGSASILQGRLAQGLPGDLEKAFPGLGSDARRALQFARSTPGMTTALVGMKQVAHVEENLALAATPPASLEALTRLFQPA